LDQSGVVLLLTLNSIDQRWGMVIGPRIRIERGVSNNPRGCTGVFVRSRSGLKSATCELPVPEFGIHGRKNQADFADEVPGFTNRCCQDQWTEELAPNRASCSWSYH